MRCAILVQASDPSAGPDRLVSLAIHATTERRASDHPPPTASSTSGQKVKPAWVLWAVFKEERVFAGLNRSKDTNNGRGVSEGGTHTKVAGDGRVPRLLASAEAVPGYGGSGSGERSSSTGSRGIKRPGFPKTVPRLALSLAAQRRRP